MYESAVWFNASLMHGWEKWLQGLQHRHCNWRSFVPPLPTSTFVHFSPHSSPPATLASSSRGRHAYCPAASSSFPFAAAGEVAQSRNLCCSRSFNLRPLPSLVALVACASANIPSYVSVYLFGRLPHQQKIDHIFMCLSTGFWPHQSHLVPSATLRASWFFTKPINTSIRPSGPPAVFHAALPTASPSFQSPRTLNGALKRSQKAIDSFIGQRTGSARSSRSRRLGCCKLQTGL